MCLHCLFMFIHLCLFHVTEACEFVSMCSDTVAWCHGDVPCEVVNCLMLSEPRSVFLREIFCLYMLH